MKYVHIYKYRAPKLCQWRSSVMSIVNLTAFKKFEVISSALANHIISNFLKAVFHKFYLIHSWIPWPIFPTFWLWSCKYLLVAFFRNSKDRSSHRRFSLRKGTVTNFAKLTGKHLCQSLFLIKLQSSGLQLY